MATSKRAVLTAQLPPTPCTPEMRETLVGIAKQRNITIAEIQRLAFSLFLSSSDTSSVKKDNELSIQE
jgi:hypothetical protein